MAHRAGFGAFVVGGVYVLVAILAMVGLLFTPADAAAQAANGALVGNVKDESGAAVPGATITAIETRTNISRTAVSNETGNYSFNNLASGIYRVEAELVGFTKSAREGVEVNVNTTVRVDISLKIGELSESVMVTGEAPMLQTDRTDTGRIIQSEQITQMPLGFNRNFQGLLVTVPGASRPHRPHSEFYNSQDSLSSEINGQGRQSNNVQLEGADNSDNGGNLAFIIPSAEAIETVAVTTSNYDAEFGRAGGAVTNVTLKSGTNDLAGSVFSFGNTEATAARNPFSQLPVAETKYLQGGFTLGGPIMRNKLFFFGDYVRTADDSGRLTQAHIPEAAFRNGDFSAAPTIIYDPRTGNADGSARTPFPNNQIPLDRISPIARQLLSNIPMPNLGAGVGVVNYEKPYVREKRTNQYDMKFTIQAATNDHLSDRYSKQNAQTYDPAIFGIYGGLKPFAGSGTNPTHSMGITYNRVWSPSLVQEVRIGRTSHHNEAISEAHGLKTSDQFGIKGVNLNDFTSGITTIDLTTAYSEYFIGFETSLPWDRAERTWTYATTATKLWGNHTMKIGGDLRMNRHLLDQVNHPRGSFKFRGANTAIPTDTAATNGYANAFAAFLLDVPQSIERGLVSDVVHKGGRHTSVFTYVHDKWQVRDNITLDLGLRHEYYTPLVGYTGKAGMASYDPSNNTLRVAGYNDVPENLGVHSYWKNFNPRTGISWRLNDSNVVRAGYGVSALPWPSSYGQGYPVTQIQQLTAPNLFVAAGSLAAGLPPPNFAVIPDSGIVPATPLRSESLSVVPLDRHDGQLHSWNVAFQRTLPGAFTAEVAYVGNRGVDILKDIDLNAGYTLGANQAGQPLFVKYGRTAQTLQPIPLKSKYNSLQMKVDRRMRGGLLLTNSYTLGRGYSYTNGDGTGGTIPTPADIERSWQRTSFDSTHTFNSSFVYQLPWGPQGAWLKEGVLAHVLGDWQVTGLFSAISGTPIDFTAGNNLGATGNSQTPNATGTPNVLGGIGSNKLWFDTSVFSAAPANTWGNVERRGLLTGPAYVNVDASIVKIVRFGQKRLEVRADMFNALNIAHYMNPNGTFGNGNFGRVTEILPQTERLIRFGGRFLF
jgi:hypothetical protein